MPLAAVAFPIHVSRRRSLKLPASQAGVPWTGKDTVRGTVLVAGQGACHLLLSLSPHPAVSLSRWHRCLLGSSTPGCWQTDGHCRQIFLLQHRWALRWAEGSGLALGR